MNDFVTWTLLLFAMMLATYPTRLSVIMLVGQGELPDVIQRALRFVPPAAFAAIVFPEVLLRDDAIMISPVNVRLLAGIIAALVAWKTRQTLLAILAGMVALWILQIIL